MRLSRADRSRLTDWWFTIDHVLMAAIFVLIGLGCILSLAASPSVALKKGFDAYYFVERHLMFSALGAVLVLVLSFMTPREVRRLSLILMFLALAGLIVVDLTGAEINGARRWLSIAGASFQPSELAKPAFVVLSAWLLAEARMRPDMPALPAAIGLWLVLVVLLARQPDVGQTLLASTVWGALFFVSGQPLVYAAALVVLGVAGLAFAYFNLDYVAARVDRFFDPIPGDRSQADRALQSFTEGGFFGRGPGEGTIKTVLPDAHTDYIFAVVAEEYGAVACVAIVILFAFIALRALHGASRNPEPSNRLAIIGLAALFGLQALLNMGVNVGLLPAKGITLPYLSVGGSSTLAVSVLLGMLLALTRRRPIPPAHST
ncbi:MAG: putative peptidoglycan glycosyltransferase FtsW [Hyphomicrobium sp.]|nr:putative peptidoglycan glycosyltransferase FtsW [Hyphomicrobium sp.]